MRYSVPLVNHVRNVLRGVSASEPVMERNLYDLSEILELFQSRDFEGIYLKFSGDSEFLGVTVYAQRKGTKRLQR